MKFEFILGPATWFYETDEAALSIRASVLAGREKKWTIAWNQIIGAGHIGQEVAAPQEPVPELLPLPGNILEKGAALARRLQNIVIVYLAENGGRKTVFASIAAVHPQKNQLLSELKTRLGGRWLGENQTIFVLRKKLGLKNWWIPPAALFALAVGFLILLFLIFLRCGALRLCG
ncbi:hypothetical protein EPN90_00015 [Patescibacteria group bacterium]|nr:MAG: hypothetical protein EPN90_00015 [Patescibacteria group bacterium]